MSEERQKRETGQDDPRTDLHEYLEGLVKRFDGEGRRRLERIVPAARPEGIQAPGSRERPATRAYPDEEEAPAAAAGPRLDVDDIVELQLQVRDEIRALRQTMESQHLELLDALQAVAESTPRAASILEAPARGERSGPSAVDEYQEDLLEDLHRATRRLLNWYVALEDELSGGRSRS